MWYLGVFPEYIFSQSPITNSARIEGAACAPERSELEVMATVKCNGDAIHHSDEEVDLSCSSPETKIDSLVSNHPLKYVWTYWYLNDQRDKSWEKRLKVVSNFGTVEEFWA
ncbi:unnamed protein product [Onchocerca flexuosa]|uniref:Translation initiation factor eIF4E n=1 Tax=Onchocerca flexuosa TaxID=387005 RepID=A0A183HBZ0_9BILA|nr:unnamed protein product [Onchocerca flexuosa]